MPDTYVGAGHARRSVSLAAYQGREPLPGIVRYTGRNENFVLVSRKSRGGLQADSAEKLVEIICDALVEPVQCASFVFSQLAISRERA